MYRGGREMCVAEPRGSGVAYIGIIHKIDREMVAIRKK